MKPVIVGDLKFWFKYTFSDDSLNGVYLWLGEQPPNEEDFEGVMAWKADSLYYKKLRDASPGSGLPSSDRNWGYLGCGNASGYIPEILESLGITDSEVVRKARIDSF